MNSLIYLYKRTIVNRVKKALKRPTTYIALVFIILYIAMIFFSLDIAIKENNFGSAENMVTLLSLLIFFLNPANIISYSKRKGLLFRPSDVHFVFPSPVSPKKVLMYAGVKSFALNFLLGIVITVLGILWFDAAIWQMLVYFLFFVVFESTLEASIIIFCYGNERLSEKFFKRLTVVLYAFMAVLVGTAAYLMITQDLAFALIQDFLSLPVVQFVPIIGWNVAAIRLIFLGADIINVIGTVLYLLSTIGMFLVAWRMKCTGNYYEDAMKFAEEYQVKINKQKKGVASIPFLEKHRKFRQASVEYKGVYAKAIYFRQILEYKKNPTFIFGWNTLLCFGLGILIAVVGYFNDAVNVYEEAKIFIIPAVACYVTFIFSGYATKWAKELENAYTYLIPDTPLRKLWYATKIEHIRAIIDGLFITIPGAIVFGIGPVMAALTVLLYICLQANHLYYNMLADALIGKTLGQTGRSLIKVLFQGIAISIAAIAAVVGGVLLGIEAGFFIMIAVMGLLTFAGAAGASISFAKMEMLD